MESYIEVIVFKLLLVWSVSISYLGFIAWQHHQYVLGWWRRTAMTCWVKSKKLFYAGLG